MPRLFGNQLLLAWLESCKTMKEALQLHAQIILNGFDNDFLTIGRLISHFSFSGSKTGLEHSRVIFSRIASPSIFIWNTMIRGYSRSNTPEDAVILYMSMLDRGKEFPNSYTFPFLLNSCARLSRLEPGQQVHCHALKCGFESDIFLVNALIHFYGAFRDLKNAYNVFKGSLVKDLVSYNTMINVYVQVDQPSRALQLFSKMQGSHIKADDFTFVALLTACSSLGDLKMGKQMHCLIYKNLVAFDSNTLLTSAIVGIYAKLGCMNVAERAFSAMGSRKNMSAWSSMVSGYAHCGEIEVARQIFDQMCERDVVSWTVMINGYSHAGQYLEALELFVRLENHGVKPDVIAVISILSVCTQLGALEFGRRIHYKYVESRFFGQNQNAILTSAVIDMYAKCGCIDTALDIFYKTPPNLKTTFLFNSMISGLAQYGLGKSAIEVFKETELAGLRPDEITFVALLSACSHCGLVDEGKKYFESMSSVHGIKPQMEHYGCMVDLLGRDGHLEEAYDLIHRMPLKANSVIWRSLLSASKIHGNGELAAIAGQKLLEMDPDHGARYVILSSMLADANQWEEASRVRKVMDNMGIQKPPGWSYVELNGTLHKFLASDRSHPEAKDIELVIKDIAVTLKDAGYVPITSKRVFDIGE